MADTTTQHLKLIKPEYKSRGWNTKRDQNDDLQDLLLWQERRDNYVHEGVVPSDGSGLDLDTSKGILYEEGRVYYVAAGSITLTASERNYVYFLKDVLTTSTTVPTSSEFNLIAVVETGVSSITSILDIRKKKRIPIVENFFINGTLDQWQRATSQTSNAYGSVDMIRIDSVGSTKTVSQQTFTVGQTDVPGEPIFFLRVDFNHVTSSSNYTNVQHRIKKVYSHSEKRWFAVFWAKAGSAMDICIEGLQKFGTSGSADVTAITPTTISLTTSWKKYAVPLDYPSVSGKTINAGHLAAVVFWLEAGSLFDSRTNSLGQQSGIVDFAMFDFYPSEVEQITRRKLSYETLRECTQYYQKSWSSYDKFSNSGATRVYNIATSLTQFFPQIFMPTTMAATPSVTLYSWKTGAANKVYHVNLVVDKTVATVARMSPNHVVGYINLTSGVSSGDSVEFHWEAKVEL